MQTKLFSKLRDTSHVKRASTYDCESLVPYSNSQGSSTFVDSNHF